MSLLLSARRGVSSRIRTRGREYHANGAVQILEGSPREVRAIVQGGDEYLVQIRLQQNRLGASCTCPYFLANDDICKHIWATMLEAAALGHLSDADRPRVDLDPDLGDLDGQDEPAYSPPVRKPRQKKPARKKAEDVPAWKRQLTALYSGSRAPRVPSWPAGRELLYIVGVPETFQVGLAIEVAYRDRKQNGEWGKPKAAHLNHTALAALPDPLDRRIMSIMAGTIRDEPYGYGYDGGYGQMSDYAYEDEAASWHVLPPPLRDVVLPLMGATGRLCLRMNEEAPLQPLTWDDAEPWAFRVEVRAGDAGTYLVEGLLQRGERTSPLSEPVMLVPGVVFFRDHAARFDDRDAFRWVQLLREKTQLSVPSPQAAQFLETVFSGAEIPPLDLPPELQVEEVAAAPRPRLKVSKPEQRWGGVPRLKGVLSFSYEEMLVTEDQKARAIYDADRRRLVMRDLAAEAAADELLRQLGFKTVMDYGHGKPRRELAPRNLPRVVRALLAAGWHVEAEGKLYRQAGSFQMGVTSGIDWFELHGEVDFGDQAVHWPELLAALKRGENIVPLGDGSFGLLPEDWLKKYAPFAGLGKLHEKHLRFERTQVGLLDALLAAQPEATCDQVFARARDELKSFEGIAPANPSAGFVGQLREYQREGLGWLHFLRRFGFGGCLADDMGLGKTVQVLALLGARAELRACKSNGKPRQEDAPAGPSLVVVPRSLIFNWKQEAARFMPRLRLLDHTGIERVKAGEHFEAFDVVLTTYGTLRRDAVLFKDVTFDYVILDEAQAIKNANTESAKAARLLRGRHRLALSGTPVENHLGELWSLFEFLNPGMLGAASALQLGASGRTPSPETRTLLARGLRPFILRRTKDQVARELPPKTEQTLYCELEPKQRKQYDELRDHYRRALLGRIEKEGLNKSKIQILEALLRLRQAACHPGLIDKNRCDEPGAKVDLLRMQLGEVLDEGHKALVFSQFTSLLAILRRRLDRDQVAYEYLDGRTSDRQSRVERFQNDADCKLFLVSLKAGGQGLNLTAAEYVFLLDPWWNPAVEAQAIDRAHRIGQARQVFAYRLIARDTVEEKVLELQQTKRDLADAIINADNSLIRNLKREDLELLLS